jgi:hypothetical protein
MKLTPFASGAMNHSKSIYTIVRSKVQSKPVGIFASEVIIFKRSMS